MTLITSLSRVVYHDALVFLCINQHTKLEVPSFTISKYMTGVHLKNESGDPDHASFRGGLSCKF